MSGVMCSSMFITLLKILLFRASDSKISAAYTPVLTGGYDVMPFLQGTGEHYVENRDATSI
mgnify:CR=1 FL=1